MRDTRFFFSFSFIFQFIYIVAYDFRFFFFFFFFIKPIEYPLMNTFSMFVCFIIQLFKEELNWMPNVLLVQHNATLPHYGQDVESFFLFFLFFLFYICKIENFCILKRIQKAMMLPQCFEFLLEWRFKMNVQSQPPQTKVYGSAPSHCRLLFPQFVIHQYIINLHVFFFF